MKSYKLSNMKYGWFCGDFEPAAMNVTFGEIAIKRFARGRKILSYKHPKAQFLFVILDGEIIFGGKNLRRGAVIKADYGEDITFLVAKDAHLLYVVYGDRYFTRNKNIDWNSVVISLNKIYPRKTLDLTEFSKDVSIIIQGSIDEEITPVTCRQIRKLFPNGRIIISTWKDKPIKNLEYDLLLQNEDPGGCKNHKIYNFDIEYTNNINRQLVSIKKGLEEVDTKYTLKLRSDMIPTTNQFIELFDQYCLSTGKCELFEHKVLICDLFTRHYFAPNNEYIPLLFHPSDWFLFGYTNDLKKYFSKTICMKKEEVERYQDITNIKLKVSAQPQWNCRFLPEQYYAICALRENGYKIKMNDWSDITAENAWLSEQFILNNFLVLDFDHHGFILPKYDDIIMRNTGVEPYNIRGLFTHEIYKQIYNYIFGIGNESYQSEKWDIENFYIPYKAIKEHDANIMNRLCSQNTLDSIEKKRIRKIKSNDVTVLVQGYVNADNKETSCVFDSIREWLPGANIVLSTWKGCNYNDLDYDKLILSDDPGSTQCGVWLKNEDCVLYNNYNRQITSTKNGIRDVNTPYILKIRSDSMIMGNELLDFFGIRDGIIDEMFVFSERLLIGELYSRSKYCYCIDGIDYVIPTPFHPSDWFVFGKTEDVVAYYNAASYITNTQAGNYEVKNMERKKMNRYPFQWQFPPEQQICMGIVSEKFPNITFDDWSDWSDEIISFSEDFIYSNFLILSYRLNQILSLKHDKIIYENTGYTYSEPGLLTTESQLKWMEAQHEKNKSHIV